VVKHQITVLKRSIWYRVCIKTQAIARLLKT